MNDLVVLGIGAVSPAGWGVAPLRAALDAGQPLASTPTPRPGWEHPLPLRRVPPASPRPPFLAHPRLRRASPISHFSVAAALEALGGANGPAPVPPAERLGLVFCTMTGSVIYSRRFFEETLRDPATASPLLFPETVFNAPASHLAAVLGLGGRVHTEVGDAGCFLKALATAGLWLRSRCVDHCLVVAAEEGDWLTGDGLSLLTRHLTGAEGAGALLLALADAAPPGAVLARLPAIADAAIYTTRQPPAAAARRVRDTLAPQTALDALLVDSTGAGGRFDRAEHQAWSDWAGRRLRPKWILGEAWAAGAAWQCLAAVDALVRGQARQAIVSVVGSQEQAIGARFDPATPPTPP